MQEALHHRRQFHSYVVTPTNAVTVSYYVSVNGTDLVRERSQWLASTNFMHTVRWTEFPSLSVRWAKVNQGESR